MRDVNVVCLKWGKKFGPEYVNRLYAGVVRNTTIPVVFHCFTDNATGLNEKIVVHPLPNKGLDGWWNKLYLFSGEIPIMGRLVFMDLDTLIVGNIDHILSQDTGFIALRDWYKAEKDPKTTILNSSLMSYESHKHTHIWTQFMKRPKEIVKQIHPAGDQEWIRQQQPDRIYWQDLFPDQLVSFKSHCLKGLPPSARIVCYHGKPSIPESITTTLKIQGRHCIPSPWVADHWKD